MPDEVEEFWEDIRPGRFELPEVDQGVIAEDDVREIRDIIQAVRGVPSWRNVSAESRRGFLILLQEEMAERRRRGLPPIPLRTESGLVIHPGETLEQFDVRVEAHERALLDETQPLWHRPSEGYNLAPNRIDWSQPPSEMLPQPNNTPTLGVREPPPRSWDDLEPLTEREQVIRNRAYLQGAQHGGSGRPITSVTELFGALGLPCIISSRGETFIHLTFLRMGLRTWNAQQTGDEFRVMIQPVRE